MNTVIQNIRYSFRTLMKNPGFSFVAILTLALGIGASVGIFIVANNILLKPLPYPDSDRLVNIQANYPIMGSGIWSLSSPELIDIQQKSKTMDYVEAIWTTSRSLTGDGDPEQVYVGEVTVNFFATLGVSPVLGRTFTSDELAKGGPKSVILSHGLWQRRFGADAHILGKPLMLNGIARTIVGVIPKGFRHFFPEVANVKADVNVWIPLEGWEADTRRNVKYLKTIGRLKPGITVKQARMEINMISKQINDENLFYAPTPIDLQLGNLQEEILKPVKTSVVALMVGVGFLFLIACTNFTNLLLIRANKRRHEMAVRAALGASSWTLFQYLLLENFILTGVACVFGVLLAIWGIDFLVPLMPASLTLRMNGLIDSYVIIFIVITAFILPALMGTLPMWRSSKFAKLDSLRQGKRVTGERSQKRLRQILVIGEISLSLVLIIGAGLMIRTFTALQNVNPGFDANNVLTFSVAPPKLRYPDLAANANFYDRLRQQVAQLPGIQSVGGVSHPPFGGGVASGPYLGEGTAEDKWDASKAESRVITPGYFKAVGTPVLEGRTFTELDTSSSEKVVVVDEKLARLAWPGESAVGKKVRFNRRVIDGFDMKKWGRVIGVVKHVRSASLREDGCEQIYFPHTQTYTRKMTLVVRATVNAESITAGIQREVAMLDADLPVSNVSSLVSNVSRSLSRERFVLILSSLFSGIAVALAVIGIYGVISYSVTQRTNEFGIRMALGASSKDILKQVVKKGISFAFYGVGAGLVLSIAVTPFLESLVFGVQPTDPTTFIFVSVFLAVVTIGASYIPALRATKVDPMIALRCE